MSLLRMPEPAASSREAARLKDVPGAGLPAHRRRAAVGPDPGGRVRRRPADRAPPNRRFDRRLRYGRDAADRVHLARRGHRPAARGHRGGLLQDNVTGYAEQNALLSHYTRATFAVLDGAGHNLHIEQPILFAALVEECLERVREGQSRLSGKPVQQRSTSRSAFDLPWRGHLVTPVVRCRRFDVDDVVELVVESGVEAIPLADGATSRVGDRRPGGGSVGGAEVGAVLRPTVG
jgi:hypothetical protein